MSHRAVRTLVVHCADWPIVAAGVPLDEPAAVVYANRVVASSPAARAHDITLHQRRREAQARCPSVVVTMAVRALNSRAASIISSPVWSASSLSWSSV